MDYKSLITMAQGKRGDKSCIRGMRITVYEILEYLALGMTQDSLSHANGYPRLFLVCGATRSH